MAELYFVHYVPDDTHDEEYWNFALGHRTDQKDYRCWEKERWYKYVQSKPWRTINLNTNWDANMFPDGKNYKLLVIEYDFPFYDRGVDLWCNFAGFVSYNVALFAFELGHPSSLLIAGAVTLLCDNFIINDDPIGGKMGFENVIQSVFQNPNTEFEWSLSDIWKIKLKAE